MKIFFVTSKLNFETAGGSIEEFDLMIKDLIRLGNDVTAVTVFSHGNNIPTPLPYKLIAEDCRSKSLLGIAWSAYKIFKKYSDQADFFQVDGHIFLYGAGLYRLLGGKTPISAFFNRELICWPENVSHLFVSNSKNILIAIKQSIRKAIEKNIGMKVASKIDILSFTNPVLQNFYERFGLRKDAGSLILSDPLDFQKIMNLGGVTETSYIDRNKTSGVINLFYSSRMVPGKGFDLLLEAFNKIESKDHYHLILGGSGPEENLIKQKIKSLDIEKYVELTGWLNKKDLYKYHKTADIFIQPRWRTELTSVTLFYAMAFGLPCILPGGGGLEWSAKGAAIYFKDSDYQDLAIQIETLGNDSLLRERLSKNCYKRLNDPEIDHRSTISRLNDAMLTLKK
ncbi:MAG: glycosyltransferase [Candidatus Vogelbacteria bacterium]|nr:glycosyltransferase [Candidatus Vogelbacteria bacterium]